MVISKLERITRTYRHVQRYRQILLVLSKYGFDNLVDSLVKVEQQVEYNLAKVFRRRWEPTETLSRAERARLVIEELGPTFIKMGQILSTRRDLLPADFVQEFSKLQDNAPSFPFSEAKRIVEHELQMPLEQLFQSFDEQPLAAASFGQVHRAKLVSGAEVVVKVQRPKIKKVVDVDLEIMQHVAQLLERQLEGWSIHRPTLVVDEFARLLEQELDYTIESSHMERFAWQFSGDAAIYVPKIYREFITTRVLTMEYVDGIKASDIERLEQAGLNRHLIAQQGFRLILKQIFVNGFFHADPHPGNMLILPNNVICYLDFGMMGRVDSRSRENCADLVLAIIDRNEVKATNALLKLMLFEEKPDRNVLEKEVAGFMDQYGYRPLKQIELGKFLHQLLGITSKHQLQIPPDLFLMMKALTTIEGLGRTLDPDFDPIQQARPFVLRLYLTRLNPQRFVSDMLETGALLGQQLQELPGHFDDVLQKVKRGELHLSVTMRETEPVLATLDRISNRLAFAIVLGSLIIGSSVILHANIPPIWHGIPLVGLVGFSLAGTMGFGLLISILRRGMM